MKSAIGILAIAAVCSLIFLNVGLAEDKAAKNETVSLEEPELFWIWGEVVSVDPMKGEILVKYLDYEAGSEKEEVVKVDDKTTYENVKALLEIKPQDTVSIDYSMAADGTNLAKNVSVEKPQAAERGQEEIYQQDITSQEEGKITPEDINKESIPRE